MHATNIYVFAGIEKRKKKD